MFFRRNYWSSLCREWPPTVPAHFCNKWSPIMGRTWKKHLRRGLKDWKGLLTGLVRQTIFAESRSFRLIIIFGQLVTWKCECHQMGGSKVTLSRCNCDQILAKTAPSAPLPVYGFARGWRWVSWYVQHRQPLRCTCDALYGSQISRSPGRGVTKPEKSRNPRWL